MFKLLLIGPIPTKSNLAITGGAIVLFTDLMERLEELNINFTIIDTNKRNYINRFSATIFIVLKILFQSINANHISIHSSRDYIFFGKVVLAAAKIFNKKTSLRKFGGQLISTIENSYTRDEGKILKMIEKFDYLFVETKALQNYFCSKRDNVFWFPNVRKRILEDKKDRKFSKRFVFMSHIIKDKGIDEIIEASKSLDCSYTVHLYGPMLNGEYTPSDFEGHNVEYKGELKKEEVIPVLDTYDVVLLPSYKEGYPGIIIESYSLGLPIIATDLDSIKEMCTDGKEGKLIKPKSAEDLIRAIKYFNEENYTSMSANSFSAFDNFESKKRTQEFVNIIQNN